MNQKPKLLQPVLRAIGFVLGLTSVLGGIGAWTYSLSREPERYLVSALVMTLGSILWLGYSILPKYQLTKQNSLLIGIVLFIGLTLGLFYTFNFCGGECGCFQYHGYPGYWLKGSTCITNDEAPIKMTTWHIDTSGLSADILFWIDAGILLSFIWNSANTKFQSTRNKEISS